MYMHPFYKSFFKISAFLYFILMGVAGCTTKEDQLLSPGEANEKIITTLFLKDTMCGTTHQVTFPVFTDVRMDSVSLCLQHIYVTDCDTWKDQTELPVSCSSLAIHL